MINLSDIKAIVFDMDGLMANTEYHHCQSYLELMPKYGVNLSEEYLSKLVGLDTEDNFKEIKRDFNIQEDIKSLMEKREIIYLEIVEKSNLKPSEGLKEVIEIADKKRWKIAVGSSSIKIEVDLVLKLILKALKINKKPEEYFDIIITGDDVKDKKPKPDIYLKVAENIKIKPQNCLVLEDSGSGVKAAKNAGMTCIAVRNKYTKSHDLSKADLIVDNLLEVYNLIKNS